MSFVFLTCLHALSLSLMSDEIFSLNHGLGVLHREVGGNSCHFWPYNTKSVHPFDSVVTQVQSAQNFLHFGMEWWKGLINCLLEPFLECRTTVLFSFQIAPKVNQDGTKISSSLLCVHGLLLLHRLGCFQKCLLGFKWTDRNHVCLYLLLQRHDYLH